MSEPRHCKSCNRPLPPEAHGNKQHCTNACRQRARYAENLEANRQYHRDYSAARRDKRKADLEADGPTVEEIRVQYGLDSRKPLKSKPRVDSLAAM